jgi:hypothetical protein
LYEERFGIEETFVTVERREEERCVTRGISQEIEVVLLLLDTEGWVGEAVVLLSDEKELLFGHVEY